MTLIKLKLQNFKGNKKPLKLLTFRSLSSEKVSTMMPKMMLRPMVVMNMKKDTWYSTIGQNVANVLSCSDCLTTCREKDKRPSHIQQAERN